jgi:N6-adenosine-specific RNA methylase IME4
MRSIIWTGGDWYLAAEEFGSLRKKIIESLEWREAGGPSFADCKHYGSLARRFPEPWRRLHPSPSFYQAVRRLPDEVAWAMLQQAAEENWTLKHIRREVARKHNDYTPTGPDIADSLDALIKQGHGFRAALIDPPWQDTRGDGGGHGLASHRNHYADMSYEALAALAVNQIVTDDGYVLLWCPTVLLESGLALLKAWNSRYMQALVWVKDDHCGTGHYVRGRAELLLIGVRTKSKPWQQKPDQVIAAPRGTQHSEKPPIHHLIAAAVGYGPFLEMFARRRVTGWTVIGNEIDNPAPSLNMASETVGFTPASVLTSATPVSTGTLDRDSIYQDVARVLAGRIKRARITGSPDELVIQASDRTRSVFVQAHWPAQSFMQDTLEIELLSQRDLDNLGETTRNLLKQDGRIPLVERPQGTTHGFEIRAHMAWDYHR